MSDTTTTELERLRADLEVFERYAERQPALHHECDRITREIARLEAGQADPWREAKDYFQRQKDREKDPRMLPLSGEAKHALEYVDHLTADNERLAARVAELESNAVWGIHSQVDGHLIKAFNTRAEAEAELEKEPPKFRFKEVKASCAKSIVKALSESKEYEDKYRVERDDAWRRVKELEAEIATADEITTDYSNFSQAAKEAYEKAHKTLADMQPPFEGPIVGLEPILDPSRVLATAADMAYRRADFEFAKQCCSQMRAGEWKAAKPYRVKGVENG